MGKRLRHCLLLVALVMPLFGGGCGLLSYGAVKDASTAMDALGQTDAETSAPYYFYSADEYLRMATHEQKEDDFRAARKFAAKSSEMSAKAVEIMKGGAK